MIDRYTTPEMRILWDPRTRTEHWLEVELALCEGQEHFDEIPKGTSAKIEAEAQFNLDRMAELELVTKHDVMAFVKNVQEGLGDEGRFFHNGPTSYCIVDTALGTQMRDACGIIIARAQALQRVIGKRALEFKDTPQPGRTHGVHAEPITFGFKLAGWYAEMSRNIERLELARAMVAVGKLSGAVGTHANIDPRVEKYVCDKLRLSVDPASTQIVCRDHHAQLITALAIVAGSLERYATEIRNLARSEIREVQEYFSKGQTGSSAMPHKRNPWNCETVTGLARVVRGHVVPMLESITSWHERDLANSSMERIIIPDTCMAVDWMLLKFTDILDRLIVYPERMLKNLHQDGSIVFSEAIMLALVKKGLSRNDAYAIAQRNAAKALDGDGGFRENVSEDFEITGRLSADEIDGCFSLTHHLKHIDYTFREVGLLEAESEGARVD